MTATELLIHYNIGIVMQFQLEADLYTSELLGSLAVLIGGRRETGERHLTARQPDGELRELVLHWLQLLLQHRQRCLLLCLRLERWGVGGGGGGGGFVSKKTWTMQYMKVLRYIEGSFPS